MDPGRDNSENLLMRLKELDLARRAHEGHPDPHGAA